MTAQSLFFRAAGPFYVTRLGQVSRFNLLATYKIGNRARQLEDAVKGTRTDHFQEELDPIHVERGQPSLYTPSPQDCTCHEAIQSFHPGKSGEQLKAVAAAIYRTILTSLPTLLRAGA